MAQVLLLHGVTMTFKLSFSFHPTESYHLRFKLCRLDRQTNLYHLSHHGRPPQTVLRFLPSCNRGSASYDDARPSNLATPSTVPSRIPNTPKSTLSTTAIHNPVTLATIRAFGCPKRSFVPLGDLLCAPRNVISTAYIRCNEKEQLTRHPCFLLVVRGGCGPRNDFAVGQLDGRCFRLR